MDTTLKIATAKDLYTTFYNKNRALLHASTPPFINDIRDKSMSVFESRGFPGRKEDRYKYTQPETAFNYEYAQLSSPQRIEFNIDDIFHCGIPSLNTQVILLVNGFYHSSNQIIKPPKGVWIGSTLTALKEIPVIAEKYVGQAATTDDSLTSLNTALFTDGITVYVEKNHSLDKPLQVINILLSNEDLLVQHRNLIVLEDNSSANIVICDHTLSSGKFLTNSVTEIFVGEGAQFEQSRMQNEHNEASAFHSTYIKQQRNSITNIVTVTLHGGLVRNNFYISLDGQGAQHQISGLYLSDKTQHIDNYVFVHHAVPNCTSNQFFKGVLDDSSTGAFNGHILVDRDAQKTLAYQKNNNLLLTREARMNTRPQLEIYADDVKCSHGATVGQLNQEALFYLRSRGISKPEARLLLMHAFASEVLEHISIDALRERTEALVEKRLRGELARCENCNFNCC